MRVLSWNLFGLCDDHLDERTEAAMFIALLGGLPEQVFAAGREPSPPDVLMFQEVVDRTFRAHLIPHLRAAGYAWFPEQQPAEREYFEVLAVREPLRVTHHQVTDLESVQGRELVEVTVEHDGHTWLLMTAHLESMKSSSWLRMGQSAEVLRRLRAHDGPAIFGGDTNLREAEASTLDPQLDAWRECGSVAEERWTCASQRTGVRSRYDRIWGKGVAFSGFRCLGGDEITPDGEPASDHLAVMVNARAEPRANTAT